MIRPSIEWYEETYRDADPVCMELCKYIRHLEAQVTELQARGTELVEENRALKEHNDSLRKGSPKYNWSKK